MSLVILLAPMSLGASCSGTELAPEIINKRFFYNSNVSFGGIVSLEVIKGEREHLSKLSIIEKYNLSLKECVYNILQSGNIPMIIGGDHSLSLGTVSATSSYFKSDVGVISLDAQNVPEYSPTGNIHGMTFACAMCFGYKEFVLKNNVKVLSSDFIE
ncbi:arginase family protein [Bacteroides sp.]|uniref:arginase family protein n=1 Tax=Bacteroides sp. TaxID=29523 RepID=UPI00258B1D52|nr:arginase family protein [Bacteroides sp.]